MTDQERKIIDRIKKVLAKAEGTNNQAEAEMLMAKVQSMLEEHNLNMLDVATLDADDPMGTDMNVFKFRTNDSWMRHLSSALARYYGCRIVLDYDYRTKHTRLIHVSGRESNRITWALMVPFVKKQVMALGRQLHKDEPWQYTSANMASRHIANALVTRINRLNAEKAKEDQQRVARGENALVPVDLIEAEMERAFSNLVSGRSTSIRSSGAARKAAEGVSLYRQTGGAGQRRIA